jgi:PD-(D/E)XK nuclease superfamily
VPTDRLPYIDPQSGVTYALDSLEAEPLDIRWHATGLSVFQQCPEKFRRRYIEGERIERMSASSIIGRSLHHAAQLGVEAQMAGQRVQLDFLLESATAHFNGLVAEDERSPEPIPWSDDPGARLHRLHDLRELVKLWWNTMPAWWRTWGLPTMAENHFEVNLWNHTVTGQIDTATEHDVVIDWKSGLRFLSPNRAEREMQKFVYPAAYERLTGRWPGLLVFVQLLRVEPTKTRDWSYKINIQSQQVDEAQKELLRRLLDDYDRQARAGHFPLNITSALCSGDFCPFWKTCPAHLVKPLAEREAHGAAEDDTVEETAEG